jgi:polyhydroxyalkanoate synthesis regulator phasin
MCDKWEQYLDVYDREIGPMIGLGQPLRLLEIGVQNGGSLQIWSELLPAGSEVVGIDVDPACAKLRFPEHVTVLIGDGADPGFLAAALGDGAFDVVIDDGSHRSPDIIASFEWLFPRLRPSGKYIIEDLHAAYWPEFGGGFRAPDSAIEYLKRFVDAPHIGHLRDPDSALAADLAPLGRWISRIAFSDSIAVVEKLAAEKSAPFQRMLSGALIEDSNPAWRAELQLPLAPLQLVNESVHRALMLDVEGKTRDLRLEIAELHRHLKEAQEYYAKAAAELEGRSRQLAMMTTQLSATEQQLQRSNGRVTALERRVARLRGGLDDLRRRLDAKRQKLRRLRRSWSWRLTKPFRRIAGAFVRRKA